MKLKKAIAINNWYTRSINIERDGNSTSALNAYIPTTVAKKVLVAFLNSFSEGRNQQAWSLIGPYGSGKSSFGLFLKGLMSSSASEMNQIASIKLKDLDQSLFNQYRKLFNKSEGCLTVLLTGSVEPIEQKLYQSILNSFRDLDIEPRFKKQAEAFDSAVDSSNILSKEVLQLLELIQDCMHRSKRSFKGIVLLIDELGKFIEYAGKKRIEGDIFILQELAEKSAVDSKVPISLFVMLHQAMEFYAKDLDQATKNEWRKIQGRYEEISFIENIEQSVRILSKAIETTLNTNQRTTIKRSLKKVIKRLLEENSLPTRKVNETNELFLGCYPFHPLTAVILPMLSQKLAQNERTLFSFLGSSEQNGFQDLLTHIDIGQFILPHNIFDYFISNQSSYISDHYTQRRWVEVINALDRLGDVEPRVVDLVKTIGILNITGSIGSLKSSLAILSSLFEEKQLKIDLKFLESKSVVTFRKFNDEFRIWQGSDFDFEQALSHEKSQLENLSLAEELNSILPAKPIVAKRISIEDHTLRYFKTFYVDEKNISSIPKGIEQPRVCYLLKDSYLEHRNFSKEIKELSKYCIVAAIDTSEGLGSSIRELSSLRNILSTYPEIQSDSIAKKEILDQIDFFEEKIRALLKETVNSNLSTWIWQTKAKRIDSPKSLQTFLSRVIREDYFSKSPKVANELINRDLISGQGQSARRKLIQAMLSDQKKANLGFDDDHFPPEKSIFHALFLKHNLYKESFKGGEFIYPDKNSEFFEVYKAIKSALSKADEPISFKNLQEIMSNRPFGIKQGLHPLVFMAFYLSHQKDIAIYEDSQFRPYLDTESLERFIRIKTNTFAFQLYDTKNQTEIIDFYSDTSIVKNKKSSSLEAAKNLTKFMNSLPDYVRETNLGLSEQTKVFRASFFSSRSPQDLFNKDIPRALGFNTLKSKDQGPFNLKLTDTLNELDRCYENLLLNFRTKLAETFELEEDSSLKIIRQELFNQYKSLEEKALGSTRIYLKKILEPETEDQFWLETLLNHAATKHPQKWRDEDILLAEQKLRVEASHLKEMRTFMIERNNNVDDSETNMFLIKIKQEGKSAIEKMFALDQKKEDQALKLAESIEKLADELPNKDKIVALTYALNRLLKEDKKKKKEKLEQNLKKKVKSRELKVVKGGKD